ncbi:hypothetical protein HOK51_11380 [Candidatus Woesearchaeota archaeon]|jgi:hypothetical protein|nr:hypothetical protein [Candidatus Woesearchaeota archaeon]MBT6520423.1 hypothetical protein [Candidatus Woesearchaeota archaeon]MBT7368829.1 hypothetical protein [Candidatus Woesearchaeota archaeon]
MKIKYTIPGQNIKERTESSLLSRDFDERFMMFSPFNCMKDNPYGLEKLAEVRTNKKNSNDLKTWTTKEFSYLDLMKQDWFKALMPKPSELNIMLAIADDPHKQKLDKIVTQKDVKRYVMHQNSSQGEMIVATMESGSAFTNAMIMIHEQAEIHEWYKGYKRFCARERLTAADTVADFLLDFTCHDGSANKFRNTGECWKPLKDAHKKALVAENMFIYHTACDLGYDLNFNALVDANPLRREHTETESKRFVKGFCHGHKKQYTQKELEAAEKFYKDMGCEGFVRPGCPEHVPEYEVEFPPPGRSSGSGLREKLMIRL